MIHGMQHVLFLILVALVALQRLLELVKSKKNERFLAERGGFEVGGGHFTWMRLTHAGWLATMVVESVAYGVLPTSLQLIAFAGFFALGQILRLMAMETLGKRWTAKIYCLPGEDLVKRGIYRYFPHPNYAGVVLEIFFLPLLFGCWRTAVAFTCINAVILAVRIPSEVRALRRYAVLLRGGVNA